ncbi:beta strand repeat-containing protein, partial [Segetibacter koreensis]|uniref:beta strand repeat-containing protein n=1 Tax=Segetibacter koreensis TaxID=398037 RepID=UPI0004784E4A
MRKFITHVGLLALTIFATVFLGLSAVNAQTTNAYADAGLSSPTVSSDKLDYAPGEVAHITGTGWTLDQSVHVEFKETPDYPDYHIYDISVNTNGTWQIDYPIELRHLGVAFSVLADGKQSAYRATTAFTDGSVTITAATGGSSISADNAGGTSYTTLTGPIMAEAAKGDIGLGTIILNAPSGFEFDLGGTSPTVLVTGDATSTKNINNTSTGSTIPVTRTASTLTIAISVKSNGGNANTLTWQNIRVRPTAGTPLASGNITKSSSSTSSYATIPNVTTPSYGTLAEVVGALDHFNIGTISGTKTSGTAFNIDLTAKDKFDNTVTSFTGTAGISSTVGTIAPTTSGSFGSGQLTQSVTITGGGNGKISVTSGGKTGESNSFDVVVPCTAPTINTSPSGQPASQSITYGTNATFTISAGGTATLTYQWQENTGSGFANISNGGIYSGATTTTLNITKPTVSMSGYKYRCVVTNSCGNTTSDGNATLSVAKANQTISITTPSPSNATYNTSFTVAATATSGLPVTYSSSAPLSNSGATFSMTSGTGTGVVKYNQAGDANYNAAAEVTVNVSAAKASATITLVNADLSPTFNGSGKTVGYTISPTGVSGVTVSYKKGIISVASPTDAGSYSVTASLNNANYDATDVTSTLVIGKATSTTVVSVPSGPYVYTGAAQTPATVSVTGAGGLTLTPTATYADNINAGIATASYAFAGDDNHTGSDDSKTFTIGKATSVTAITITGSPFSYTGSAITPATV